MGGFADTWVAITSLEKPQGEYELGKVSERRPTGHLSCSYYDHEKHAAGLRIVGDVEADIIEAHNSLYS